MRMIRPKAAPSRLDPLLYESLRQLVLRRDGWRCQSCGTTLNLEIHHKQFRSHSGEDSDENLITLCAACHARMHRPRFHATLSPHARKTLGLPSGKRGDVRLRCGPVSPRSRLVAGF